jgi:hypothetical protein
LPEFLMRRAALAASLLAFGCAPPPAPTPQAAPPTEAAAAAAPPAPSPVLPVRGDGAPALPSSHAVLTRIAVGCCPHPERDLPVLSAVTQAGPDLLLFLDQAPADDLAAGREGYDLLNLNAHFASLNMALPILAAPGGGASAGADHERLFETYWSSAAPGGDHPGAYGARVFGPEGRRIQVLVLDPAASDPQARWLEQALQTPAELRVIMGSPTHGSLERVAATHGSLERVAAASARTTLFIEAGGAGELRRAAAAGSPSAHLMRLPPMNAEDAPARFGLIEVDWARGTVLFSLRDAGGRATQTLRAPLRFRRGLDAAGSRAGAG